MVRPPRVGTVEIAGRVVASERGLIQAAANDRPARIGALLKRNGIMVNPKKLVWREWLIEAGANVYVLGEASSTSAGPSLTQYRDQLGRAATHHGTREGHEARDARQHARRGRAGAPAKEPAHDVPFCRRPRHPVVAVAVTFFIAMRLKSTTYQLSSSTLRTVSSIGMAAT